MEDEKNVPNTSEQDPNAENQQVNEADLEGGNSQESQPKPTGEEGDQEKNKPEEESKPSQQKQSRKTDAEYARERRERKAREEAERKAREEEIRRQAVFEVKSGQVTSEELSELGLNKVEDDDQLFLVESLRKSKANGDENPIAKAYQELFKKQSTERADAKAKAQAEEEKKQKTLQSVAEDQKNFQKKFGKTTKEVIENEPEFMELFGDLLDPEKGNFTVLYTKYSTLKKGISDAAKREGNFPLNPGTSQNNNSEGETNDEFKKRWISEHGHW